MLHEYMYGAHLRNQWGMRSGKAFNIHFSGFNRSQRQVPSHGSSIMHAHARLCMGSTKGYRARQSTSLCLPVCVNVALSNEPNIAP